MHPWPRSRGRSSFPPSRIPYTGPTGLGFYTGLFQRENIALANNRNRYGPEDGAMYSYARGGQVGSDMYAAAQQEWMGSQRPGRRYRGGWFS